MPILKTSLAHIFRFILPRRVYLFNLLKKYGFENVYLYGAGELGIELYTYLEGKNIEVKAWFDLKANSKDFRVLGQEVCKTTDLRKVGEKDKVIICSVDFESNMLDECKKQGLTISQILSISKC